MNLLPLSLESLSARMKAGSAFITPLSGLAQELVRPHLKADPNAPIFQLHRQSLHQAAQRLVAGLAMERWTPHDLRRTAATILDRAGYSLEQIGALLAHTRKGVTAVYARWDKFDLRREMATAVERSLRETLDGEPRRRSRPPHRRQSPKQHDERAAIEPPFSFRPRGLFYYPHRATAFCVPSTTIWYCAFAGSCPSRQKCA